MTRAVANSPRSSDVPHTLRRMYRAVVVRTVLALGLGLLTTLMASVLIAGYGPNGLIPPTQPPPGQYDLPTWLRGIWPPPARVDIFDRFGDRTVAFECVLVKAVHHNPDDDCVGSLWRMEYGWPVPAMRCFYVHLMGNYNAVPEATKRALRASLDQVRWRIRGAEFPSWARTDGTRKIPLDPVWSGLTIDTLTFGAGYWLILCIGSVRRTVRLRRNLCPHCAYSLAGITTAICPECGSPLKPAQRATATSLGCSESASTTRG